MRLEWNDEQLMTAAAWLRAMVQPELTVMMDNDPGWAAYTRDANFINAYQEGIVKVVEEMQSQLRQGKED